MKSLYLVIIIFVLSCASSKEGKDMTPREEYYLGRSVAATILTTSPIVEGKFNSYLNKLGKFLSYYSNRPETFKGYHFALIKNKKSIAVSAPGGIILLSTGLLASIESEDELAAVLAHEISHIAQKHAQESLEQGDYSKFGMKAGVALIGFLTGNDTLNRALEHYDELITDYSAKMIDGMYNKDQEMDADKEAMSILQRAGFDPNALIKVLQRQKTSGGGLLSNHPSDEDRIKQAQQRNIASDSNSQEGFELRTNRFLKIKKI